MKRNTQISKSNRQNRKRGFSIVELLVTMTVSLTVLSGIVSSLHHVSYSLTRTNDQVYINSQFQSLLDKFYQESRSIQQIHSSRPHVFEFSYIKRGGVVERVNYTWNSSDLILTVSSVTNGVSRSTKIPFSDVTFSYFDIYGDPVVTEYSSNVNVNAVKVTFKQSNGTTSQEVVQSPIIMFRNKTLISS